MRAAVLDSPADLDLDRGKPVGDLLLSLSHHRLVAVDIDGRGVHGDAFASSSMQ